MSIIITSNETIPPIFQLFQHFDQLLRAIDASGNLLLLSRVIEGQVKAGHWSGIEIGFTQAMAERVL